MGLFRNVLAGLGSYLLEKGKEDERQAEADLLFSRELALKQLQFQHDDAASTRDHTERLSEIGATGAEQRRTALMEGVIADRRDQSKATRDLQHDVTIKSIDFKNDAALAKLRSRLNMSEEQFKGVIDQAKADHAANSTIDHWAVDNSGALVGYSKAGKKIGRTGEGAFPVPKSGSDDTIDSVSGIAPRSTEAAAAPEPTPKLADTNDFAPRYNNATPETAPRLFKPDPATGKLVKIPLADAMKMYRSAGSQ